MPATQNKKCVNVNGHQMAYIEEGTGDPIVFLHGNPVSSYLWRDVFPSVRNLGRCIAPDLIGMGDSDKLPDPDASTYSFQTHREFLEEFLAVIGVDQNVTLVLHDWGSGLGFDWANNQRSAVRAIAYMEAMVRPFPDWEDWSDGAAKLFQAFRSELGEQLILDRNLFIERVLPGSILRDLTQVEMDIYRAPFLERDSRWPTLNWPRSIPVAGAPTDVYEIMSNYASWMAQNDLPKLFINAEPGAILTGRQREFARTWKNQTEVTVSGIHFIQEDSGAEIGKSIAEWISTLPAT